MELANPCWLRPPPTFASGDSYFSLLPSPKPTAAPSNFTAVSTSTPSGYSTLSYGKGEKELFAVGFSELRMLPCCVEKGGPVRPKKARVEEIPATSYLRNNHMAQPA